MAKSRGPLSEDAARDPLVGGQDHCKRCDQIPSRRLPGEMGDGGRGGDGIPVLGTAEDGPSVHVPLLILDLLRHF